MKKSGGALGTMLRRIHLGFFSGLAVLIFALLLERSGTAAQALPICTVVGVVLAFGSLFYAFAKFRCPHCNAALMSGRQLPMSVPAYCSHCGEPLREDN